MANLIITLIGVGLFAFALVAGMGYLSPEKVNDVGEEFRVNVAISSVASDVARYRMLERGIPSGFQDLYSKGYMEADVNGDGSLNYHVTLPWKTVDWPSSNQIKFVSGYMYLCFGGVAVSKNDRADLEEFDRKHPANSIIGKSCHLSADEALDATSPGPVWVTYRLN